MKFKLTRQELLKDLYIAFYDAKRYKSSMSYVKKFEKDLKKNINSLCDDLFNRAYVAMPSKCFIIDYPKKREVFAAQFRDRIVHHLYFNYTHDLFERTFIQDTYSCIKNRGTHYGVKRLIKHIRSESHNYSIPCYAMKLDIRGYFMHINRLRLLEIARGTINKMRNHRVKEKGNMLWEELIDIDFVDWLTEKIILLNPINNCQFIGSVSDWDGLDYNKSLFHTNEGCGLPIGNLTSQLFSNVYLNEFDQFIKRSLHCKHYGRYVDDAFIISTDKKWMLSLIPKIQDFLKNHLMLDLHMGKLRINDINQGVEFLGAFIKPYRTYVSNASLRRAKNNIYKMNLHDREKIFNTVNSYLGMMIHYSSYNIRKNLFLHEQYTSIASFDSGLTKMDKNSFLNNNITT